MKKTKISLVSTVVGMALANGVGHAGGFSLYTEGSAAAIGNYAAGIAAEVMDASTGWYNPAGLVFLGTQQAVVSGVGVFPSTELTGTSIFATPPLPPYIQSFSNLQGAESALVPSLHYAKPVNDRLAFGLSLVSPYGLSTSYGEGSPIRYAATLTKLMTEDVTPEIGYRLNDWLSLGAGLDLEWAQVKFNSMLGIPTVLQLGGLPPSLLDSSSYNKGNSFGVGFHAGVLGIFNASHTRIGFNYQSKVNHTFHGNSTLTGPLADPFLTDKDAVFRNYQLSSNAISLPAIATLSGYQAINEQLALLGSVVYTGWDVFRTIQLNNVSAFSPIAVPPQVLLNINTTQNYRNAWRFALGANYCLSNQWMLRIGGGYDETPTVDAFRNVRLPDSSRWAASIGGHYQMNPWLGFDAGYTYLFSNENSSINEVDPLGTAVYNVNAVSKAHAQLVGLQVVWTVDPVTEKLSGYK